MASVRHIPPSAPPLTAPTPRRDLRSLQIGRGLAAMFVVLFHLNNSVWSDAKYFPHPFSPLLSFGNAGVQFFFVLSGFIIYLVHGRDIGQSRQLKLFAIKRFVRIYPTYWIVLAAFVFVLSVEPFWGTADERRLGNFIASFFLLPVPIVPILSVAWTLKHEMVFYGLFAVAIVNATIGLWLFALWQLACLAQLLFGAGTVASDATAFAIVLSPNNLLFSFGWLAAYAYKTRRCPAPGMVAIAGATLFFAVGLHQTFASVPWSEDVAAVAYGLASAVAIFGACTLERRSGIRAPTELETIGDASYAIYLIHLPLLSIFAKALFATGLASRLPESVSLIVLLAGVTGAGIVFSKVVEMPLVAFLGSIGRSVARRPRAA